MDNCTNEKLCIACVHLKEPGNEAVLVDTMEPVNEKDSGEMFACRECCEKGPNDIKQNKIENWMVICKGCLASKCINGDD